MAEDFDFLRRALLEPANSPWDGGGSLAFWRPVAHQAYYEVLGGLILSHPRWVAAIHVVLLAAGALLLYRVLRRAWPGHAAAAAASFPLLAESSRTLIGWPSHFVDVGVFLFSALALHEAAARRLPTSLASLLAALLCKEVAVVAAVLLPFLPGRAWTGRRERWRWALATAATVAAWAAVYLVVRRTAGLALPHALESDPSVLATPVHVKLAWALRNSARAVASLAAKPGSMDGLAAGWAVLMAAGLAAGLAHRAVRDRLRAAVPWAGWGAAWVLLGWATLASIFPFWAPNRSQFGSVGLGVAAVAVTEAVHPALTAALVLGRLGLLAAGPGAPATISRAPEDRGAFMDFPRLVRLQRLMRATRDELRARFPSLPRGSTVALRNLPLAAAYAYGGPHALQVWYRDASLGWVGSEDFRRDSALVPVALVEYQPDSPRPVVLLEPAAVRAHLRGVRLVEAGRWTEAIAELLRADSLQRDTTATVFRGDNAGRRAGCWASLGRAAEAEREARAALRAAPEDVGARYVLAVVHLSRGERAAAGAELDTLLAYAPRDSDALALKERVGGADR